jgi:hypothetical protein
MLQVSVNTILINDILEVNYNNRQVDELDEVEV